MTKLLEKGFPIKTSFVKFYGKNIWEPQRDPVISKYVIQLKNEGLGGVY